MVFVVDGLRLWSILFSYIDSLDIFWDDLFVLYIWVNECERDMIWDDSDFVKSLGSISIGWGLWIFVFNNCFGFVVYDFICVVMLNFVFFFFDICVIIISK